MPSWNDLALIAFITLLVFGGIYVPRLGDAIGRLVIGPRGPRDEPPDGTGKGGTLLG